MFVIKFSVFSVILSEISRANEDEANEVLYHPGFHSRKHGIHLIIFYLIDIESLSLRAKRSNLSDYARLMS